MWIWYPDGQEVAMAPCVLVQSVERLSFYFWGTCSRAAHCALPAPTETHTAPTQTWPAWMAWCWSSSSADQDGSLYIYEDSKDPSLTGLRHSVYPVAGPRSLPLMPAAPVQLLGCKPLLNTHTQNQVYPAVGPDLRSPRLPSLRSPGQASIQSPSSPVAASQTSYPAHQLLWLEVCQQIALTHAVLQFLRETYTQVTLVAGIQTYWPLWPAVPSPVAGKHTYTQNCMWDHTESRNRI